MITSELAVCQVLWHRKFVRGIAKPDVLTDRYSLAVVLFKLFFRGDPLEGSKVLQCVVMTEEND